MKSADMITLYRGNMENFDGSCGHYGKGPFCSHDRSDDIDRLYQWSVSLADKSKVPKFVSMIFEVPASGFTTAAGSHYRIMGIFHKRCGKI